MTNLAVQLNPVVEQVENKNIISFDYIKMLREQEQEKPAKQTKVNNRVIGESTEVYAFKNMDEIKSMIDVFDKHIEEAENNDLRKIASRNKLLFLVGINIGIRASDLRELKWSFFFYEDSNGELKFNDYYSLQPKKQRKQKKFVKLHFNQTVRQAINNYIKDYPIENLDDYLFYSRVGDEPIEVNTLRRVIKSAAKEAGIMQNIGSHSLRKTWGFWCWHESLDKNKALVILQQAFNHSSTQTTMKYIGLMDEEISDMYNSINLGLDFI